MPLKSIHYSYPYILFFVFLIINSIPLYKKNRKNIIEYENTFQTNFLIFGLFIFFGLRGFVYSDCTSYYPYFEKIPIIQNGNSIVIYYLKNSFWEKGFLLLAIISKSIWNNYFFWQVINVSIDLWLLLSIIKENTPQKKGLALCFFFIFGLYPEMNLLRNIKAMLLFLFSLKYIEKKKFCNYFCLNLIGSFFHITAILYIPLYFILGKRINKKLVLFIYIVSNFLFLAKIRWFGITADMVGNLINGRLGYLLKSYSNLNETPHGISIGFIERTLTFYFVFKYHTYTKRDIIIQNLMIVYILSTLLFFEVPILFERVPMLFVLIYMLFYPCLYCRLNSEKKHIFLILFVVYSLLKLISGNNTIVTYYENIISTYHSIEERTNFAKIYTEKYY